MFIYTITKRSLLIAGVASLLCTALIPASASAARQLPTNLPTPPPINWQPCPDAPTRDCATLTVPLDYADLSKGNTEVSAARAPALDPANRIGTLVYNPGGPGFSVTGLIQFAPLSLVFTEEVQQRFDIVGIDPRGTEGVITCLPNSQAQLEYWETNHFARSLSEINDMLGLEEQMNQGCLDLNGPIVEHMDSASTIRDMEMLRRAMGIEKFNYHGDSYGTFLGYRYANLFPGHLRAMLLDGVTDRSISDMDLLTRESQTVEQAWARFRTWCHANTSCSMQGQNIDAIVNQLMADARTNPISAPNGLFTDRSVNDWILNFAILVATLPGDITFEWVDTMVEDARNGDASLPRAIYDEATGAIDEDTYFPDAEQRRATTCLDTAWSEQVTSPQRVRALSQLLRTTAPRFGESFLWQGAAQCYKYPITPVEVPPVDSTVTDDFPVLVIGGTLDAQTPYSSAVNIANQIAGARLLTREGQGHISHDKSRCVQAAIDDYFVNLTLPAEGAVCPTDPDLYPPQPVPQLPPSAAAFSEGDSKTFMPEVLRQSARYILQR
jgi:pimeloyl-ACP methyl ester carboxylesterase